MIKESSSWKVGNGCSIRVWEDNWLPGDQWKKPFTPKPEGCMVQKAKNLLHTGKEGWNEELIQQIFSKEEAQLILSIPVSIMRGKDRLVWSSSQIGQYSVSLGYKLAKVMNEQKEVEVGRSCRRNEEEKLLWKSLDIEHKKGKFSIFCGRLVTIEFQWP